MNTANIEKAIFEASELVRQYRDSADTMWVGYIRSEDEWTWGEELSEIEQLLEYKAIVDEHGLTFFRDVDSYRRWAEKLESTRLRFVNWKAA